jgi:hypothetical protein
MGNLCCNWSGSITQILPLNVQHPCSAPPPSAPKPASAAVLQVSISHWCSIMWCRFLCADMQFAGREADLTIYHVFIPCIHVHSARRHSPYLCYNAVRSQLSLLIDFWESPSGVVLHRHQSGTGQQQSSSTLSGRSFVQYTNNRYVPFTAIPPEQMAFLGSGRP